VRGRRRNPIDKRIWIIAAAALVIMLTCGLWLGLSSARHIKAEGMIQSAMQYLLDGNAEAASAALEKALALEESERGRVLLCNAYLGQKEGAAALKTISPLLKGKDPSCAAFCTAAQVYRALGDHVRALEYAQQAIYADPMDPQGYLTLAEMTDDRQQKQRILLDGLSMVEDAALRTALEKIYVQQLPAPIISPAGGDFEGMVEVALTFFGSDEAVIYYTLDGTPPDAGATLYTGSFTVSQSTTVRAAAALNGWLGEEAIVHFVIADNAAVPEAEENENP